MTDESQGLKKVLKPIHLWAIGVGLVISGEYFGWNYGWGVAGTVGLLIATLLITVLYFTFIFSFTELTTAIPNAGGPFAYALQAFGPWGALIAGYATLIEFLFATPAIALALGSYIHFLYPAVPVLAASISAYILFTIINLLGIQEAAWFSLIMTLLAIVELLVFIGVVAPDFKLATFLHNPMPFGWGGVFAALPFAIWLYVCLEGIAMVAEEVRDEKNAIAKGYISALLTLTVLALAVMFCVGGIADWEKLDHLDYPLPESIALVVGRDNPLTKAFASVGLFGLIASFHGIIISYSRQIFALARSGYLPGVLASVSKTRQVPYWALLLGAVLGILALCLLDTSNLVVLSTIGAVVVYIISMLALFTLRQSQPTLNRPFKAPFYPVFPALALLLAVVALAAMIYFYSRLSLLFFIGLMIVGGLFYASSLYRLKTSGRV
ncbi:MULTISPECIES: ethanolamine permease [unclassified Spirosoma]|uniref:ethanolamine permease n=1 Tax=unclassified Spirosoma TaxID=2621999 RepID=UPI00096097A4|nr:MULTISPECIES: ethanolamine permease [unclassified Spirosoma]MBN8821077.1 ethanolamine permease [Spirosoma sp.]OJW79284.1 MAG: ethanolamine permease [Spirosoma sp. 48-14]